MSNSRDEKTFPDVAAEIWGARRFVFWGLVLGALAASLFVLSARPQYRAQMIVSPANPMSGAEVSSLLADDSLFALRYLVQRVGVSNSSDFMRFENVYDGASVAAVLLKDSRIRQGLADDRSFRFSRPAGNWSPEELSGYIGRRVKLEAVGATPMRRLVYLHPDRAFAVYFLRSLHHTSDDLIRLNIRDETTKRIAYLEEAIARTGNPENRRALTALLLEQERLRMLVSIDTAYAAAEVEPPSAGVKPWWPQPLLIFSALMFVGALTGFVINGFRNKAEEQNFAPAMSRGGWFSRVSGNANRKPLNAREAAE